MTDLTELLAKLEAAEGPLLRYTIVFGERMPELTLKVNGNMRKGWMPQGGICFYARKGAPLLVQVMVKGKEASP